MVTKNKLMKPNHRMGFGCEQRYVSKNTDKTKFTDIDYSNLKEFEKDLGKYLINL